MASGPKSYQAFRETGPCQSAVATISGVCTTLLGKEVKLQFFVLFVSSGAETPVYVAMLPINAGKPQGEFLKDKVILEWQTMSFRSHAVAADKDSLQEGR